MKFLESVHGHALDDSDEEPEEEEEEEEDLVDPLDTLRESCKAAHCMNFQEQLDSCNDRVSSRSNTTEECVEELMDLFHCMDHCASKTLFSKLK